MASEKTAAFLLIFIILYWAFLYDGNYSFSHCKDFIRHKLSPANADSQASPVPVSTDLPKVLLISYDGFRWDYLKRAKAPNLKWLIEHGVYATEGLKNTFITITAPNHYGIVTGLYEESHGIVANYFYDPVLNRTFDYFTTNWMTDPRFFRRGEPIWVTNDKAAAADEARRSGCVMWVGCDIMIEKHMPQFWISWNQSIPWEKRIDYVISWFLHPTKPINMGLLYIEEPDETGHAYGASSQHTIDMVEKLDQVTAYLLWSLYRTNLLDKVNLIFTADHGMADVPKENVVELDRYVDPKLYTVYGGTPNWNVLPNSPDLTDAIYAKVQNVPHLNVYKKPDIPLDYYYANTSGVMPLQFVAEEHYWLAHNAADSGKDQTVRTINVTSTDGSNATEKYRVVRTRGTERLFRLDDNEETIWGEHGYNNSLPDMHPYFIGHGPAFKEGFNVTQFMNVDLYPLMCYILGITPAANNGSFERVRSLLRDEGAKWPLPPPKEDPVDMSMSDIHLEVSAHDSDSEHPGHFGHLHRSFGHFSSWSYGRGFFIDFLFMILILVAYIIWIGISIASFSVISRPRVRASQSPLSADPPPYSEHPEEHLIDGYHCDPPMKHLIASKNFVVKT